MQPQYLRNQLYQKNSPLFHVGSYMKKTLDENDHVSSRLLSLVFKNISEKEVIAIQGIIHNYSPFNEKLTEIPFTLIEISSLKPGMLYGETVFFNVHQEAVIFKIEIKRITFQGFETHSVESNEFEILEKTNEYDLAKEKKYVLDKHNPGYDYINDLNIGETHYFCVCGSMNQLQNNKCIYCHTHKETYVKLFNFNHIKEVIESDTKDFHDSLFQNSELSFEMTDEDIEKNIKAYGHQELVKKIEDELHKFEKLNDIIKTKVNENKDYSSLFVKLIDKIETKNQGIEVLKKEEWIKNKIHEEKKKKEIEHLENVEMNNKNLKSGISRVGEENYLEARVTLNQIDFKYLTEQECREVDYYKFLAYLEFPSIQVIIQHFVETGAFEKKLLIEKFMEHKYYEIINDKNALFQNEFDALNEMFKDFLEKRLEKKKRFNKILIVLFSFLILIIILFFLLSKQSIALDYNGGVFDGHSAQSISYRNIEFNYELDHIEPIRSGYTFVGWQVSSGDIVKNISFSLDLNRTFQAVWEKNYSITYNIYDGNEFYSNVLLNENENIESLSLGSDHTLLLTSTGRVFSWGRNYYGQLGADSRTSSNIPVEITSQFHLNLTDKVIMVSSGGTHSSAITSSGRVFLWGSNSFGQLGDGTNEDRHIPTDITAQFNLPNNEKIVSISLGDNHSAALTSLGRLFLWGYNFRGQLGDSTFINKSTPVEITSRLGLTLDEKIVEISMGDNFSSVVTSKGKVFTWGNNLYGQLGDGTTSNKNTPVDITSRFGISDNEIVTSISIGYNHSIAKSSLGRVFMWGFRTLIDFETFINSDTPLEITELFELNETEKVTSIFVGGDHSSALTSSGRVFTWGINTNGQLGDETTTINEKVIEITSQFMFIGTEKVISIFLGGEHSSALTSNGNVYLWGRNFFGQLGNQSSTNQYIPFKLSIQYAIHTEIIEYTQNSEIFYPVLAIPNEYTLDGWYTDSRFTNKFVLKNMPTENITLYGRRIVS